MEIKITYVGKINGIGAITCGFKSQNMVVEEEREVLYPSENKELLKISTGEIFSSVWLKNGDVKSNYKEIEIKEEE